MPMVGLVCATMMAPLALRGGDVSEIPEVEATGAKYSADGKVQDPFDILQTKGWNFVRFRVWNDPKQGWCDEAHTLALAKRAKAHGMQISLDFHYSDWWADPGKQTKPAAWKDLPFNELSKSVHDFTQKVVADMVEQGTPPMMVQVGNEIIGGMLWPDGKVDGNDAESWQRLGALLKAGIRGVHDGQGKNKIRTLLHLDRGADNKACIWWYDHVLAEEVDFDDIGLSYYPFWHGSLEALQLNLDDLATRYRKNVYVVETGYPFKIDPREGDWVFNSTKKLLAEYEPTIEGQSSYLAKLVGVIKAVPDGRGKGLLYWAPTWIAPKDQFETYANLALFDYEGNSLPGVDVIGKG